MTLTRLILLWVSRIQPKASKEVVDESQRNTKIRMTTQVVKLNKLHLPEVFDLALAPTFDLARIRFEQTEDTQITEIIDSNKVYQLTNFQL